MKFIFLDIQSILAFPPLYRLFSNIVGGNARSLYVEKYVRSRNGDKILDIGCGSSDILLYLPIVQYVGLDMSQAYIKSAKNRFGNIGTFLTKKLNKDTINELPSSDFDLVLATGVLHHLNDDDAIQLFKLAKSTLKPEGRLITLDGCYMKGQSWLARFILSRDRGKYIRTKDQYINLASKIFSNIKISIHHDLIRIPYTHIVMECTK